MRIPLASIPLSVLALAIGSELALAHASPPPPDARAQGMSAAVYDPQQFPALRGEVQQFTLTGRGDIDGFILRDGTEVKTPPELSTQLAFVLKPGSHVTIHGLRAAALPLVRAVSVTDESTHQTVTDSDLSAPLNPPPPREGPPGPPETPEQAALAEQSGRVRMALHGPQGEVNGVLLESGALWRFPPAQAAQLGSLLQPRQSLVAEGTVLTSTLGTVVEVEEIGTSRDRLVAVGPPMPPPPGPGPRDRGLAPPPPPGYGAPPQPRPGVAPSRSPPSG
jgi:hypothetical protein